MSFKPPEQRIGMRASQVIAVEGLGEYSCCVICHDISSVCVCSVCVACNGLDVMRCANTDRCIHTSYVCDGHDTCGDWTDEIDCSQSTFSPLICIIIVKKT